MVPKKHSREINKMDYMAKWRKFMLLMEELCSLSNSSHEVPREQMPQIRPQDMFKFLSYLRGQGIDFKKTRVNVTELKPAQNMIDLNKVRSLIKAGYEKLTEGHPILISIDNTIIDGTHRWRALYYLDKHADMPVWLVSLDTLTLIKIANRFKDSYNEGL